MATLMTSQTFDQLAAVREELVKEHPPSSGGAAVAGVFVPWAGAHLIRHGGIYFVGMGTKGGYGNVGEQTIETCCDRARELCINQPESDYWQFLDCLSWALLGAPSNKTVEQWGWSNILKIGWDRDYPMRWPNSLKKHQVDACVTALREEFSQLRRSLIFIGSYDGYGVLEPAIRRLNLANWKDDYDDNWNKDDDAGIYWLKDETSGNLYVHGYHPRAAVLGRFWGKAAGHTVHLARCELQRFN